jgi:uncharacterized protein
VIQADLATDEGCLKVEKYILENQVDVLINNAGFGTSKAFTMSTLDIEQQLLDVLVRTPMRLMHVALPLMKAAKSRNYHQCFICGWIHCWRFLQRF